MDRKRFGDGKALAPIFGKKKPRQALLAHPNNSQPNTAPCASYGGGMHYGTTSNAAPYKNQLGTGVQPSQQSHRNQFSSTRGQPQQQQQANTPQEQYQLPNHGAPYRGSNMTGIYEKKQHSNYNFMTSKGPTQPPLVQPSDTVPQSRTVHQSGTMPGRSVGMPVTPRSVRPTPGETVGMSPAVGQQAWGVPAGPPQSKSHFTSNLGPRGTQPDQNLARTAPHGSQTKKPTESFENKGKLDISLRLLTATVATLQRWAQYTQKTTLMFEIVGMLNSAVLMVEKETAKEFVLKDETGVIKCIFYQIDRDLDRMTRGQWYRCVGTFDANTRRLRCVSVRPTTTEERRHGKMSVAASDKAMIEVIKRSREM